MAAPFFTLCHELGHALIPLTFGHSVQVKVGSEPSLSIQSEKLSLQLGSLKPWYGHTNWEKSENETLTLLLGPLVSLLLALGFLLLSRSSKGQQIRMFYAACVGWCFFQFLFTLAPVTYPDWLGYESKMLSDGNKLLLSYH